MRRAKASHDAAMRLNPALALHSLKATFSEAAADGAFADVLASAMQQRQQRQGARDFPSGGGPASAGEEQLVPLTSCEARRAQRDVLRLQGEEAAADELEEQLLADLAGRKLPPPVYEVD